MACLLQQFEFVVASDGKSADLGKSQIGITRAPERFKFRILTVQ